MRAAAKKTDAADLRQERVRIIPIFLPHAGCPARCLFCDQQAATGLPAGADPAVQLSAGIQTMGDRKSNANDRREVAFYGGNFTGLDPIQQRRLLATVRPFIDSGRIDGVRVSTRPDWIDAATLALLSSGNVDTIEIGAQSMDDGVLAACNRGHTAKQVRTAARLIKERGLKLGIHLMAGLPRQSAESLTATVQEVIALRPDFVRLHPTLVLRGSGLEAMMKAGQYEPLSMEDAVDCCAAALAAFRCADIPMARLGIHLSEDLASGGAVVAGPAHPSFRNLVESRIFLRMIEFAARDLPSAEQQVRILCHPTDRANVAGYKGCNREPISGLFCLGYTVKIDERIAPHRLALEAGGAEVAAGPSVIAARNY